MNTRQAMRFFSPSLLGLFGLLSATCALASGDTDFMSVREKVAKDYEKEEQIPTEKYFSECNAIVRSAKHALAAHCEHELTCAT